MDEYELSLKEKHSFIPKKLEFRNLENIKIFEKETKT